MIPAEFTDWIDNLVHLPQGHSVHLLVELVEVRFYLLVVVWAVFVMTFIQHSEKQKKIRQSTKTDCRKIVAKYDIFAPFQFGFTEFHIQSETLREKVKLSVQMKPFTFIASRPLFA